MNVEKNIKIYKIYSAFSELLIVGPIIVLYLIAKGLSFTEIMLLQSICAISVVIFEVPTGAISDKIGRKVSLILGAAFWAIGSFIYIIGWNFYLFALAEIIFSLGSAFKSGSDTAMIYDTLKAANREKEFQKIEGLARSYIFYAQGIGSIIAGYVYEININLPMIISIGFMIITMIIALMFKEPNTYDEQKLHNIGEYFDQIIQSGKHIFKHEKIKAIILYSMIFFIFYRAGFWYFQPYMESVNIPVRYFGVIFFIFNITAAISSKYCYKIMELTKPRTLTFLASIVIISFIILGFVKVWIGVAAILLQQMARGIYRPIITKYLNKHITSDKRSTILSFESLARNIAVAVTLPIMGILKDNTDIFVAHIVLAGAMTISIVIITGYMNKRLGVKNPDIN